MRSCSQEMTSFRQEVLKLNSTVADFNNRLNAMEEKVNNIVTRIAEAEAKISASKCDDNEAEIDRHLNDRDQTSFLNDLEIKGLDEHANENPIHLITLIAQKKLPHKQLLSGFKERGSELGYKTQQH
ncbi:unnamed protein product [Parnassius apollo]|uniref:(apollo) hypothetical protein n=1 Tax=Parnassius apollo TaxID=110799 RepID=A0A8S3WFK4_PARAO|nr:unnamed protein product [Parnassius apollo]